MSPDTENESSMGFDMLADSQKQSDLQMGHVMDKLKETYGMNKFNCTVSNLGNISLAEELNPRNPLGIVNA